MNSDDYRVQRALARLGYYQGNVDGQFGPQSYRALNRYQQSQGMPVSNTITAILLRALGLQ
jgi:peptidoglycan hydrolase-like protein with peptidoglycan-binding domain